MRATAKKTAAEWLKVVGRKTAARLELDAAEERLTWGRKTKYSRTNTYKVKVNGKTKYSLTNWVKKNSWQFAFSISCNVFHFLFDNLRLNKMYNVFSNSYSMYSPSLALTISFVWNMKKRRERFLCYDIKHREVCWKTRRYPSIFKQLFL